MNPPSAIQGAMGRERKPFTYTPGGLDLSEIKSERMAKRLMRNAMNQGVPDLPPQPVQSPTTPTTPIAVPNFNALPVQVFPTFNLPANPKSLLKTRNNFNSPREPPIAKIPPPSAQNINSNKPSGMDQLRETLSINSPAYNPVNNCNFNNEKQPPPYEYNNNRPSSMYEFSSTPNNEQKLSKTTYGSDAHTSPVLPEICYDAEFFQTAPQATNGLTDSKIDSMLTNVYDPSLRTKDNLETIKTDFTIKPLTEMVHTPALNIENIYIEDNNETDNDDQTVKVVKKVKKAEKKVESEVQNQNGDQNGETEAEMTVVKVPTKKSAAKTETHVEVVKKTLPDGSIEEIKTTTTKTTVDGKTSITTKTETQIIPKAEEDVEEVEEEEEEEEEEVVVEEAEENGVQEEEPTTVVVKKTVTQAAPAVKESVVKKEESSSTTTTKKVVVVQKEEEVEEEEEEVKEEPETTTVVIKKKEEKVEKQEVKETQKVDEKQEPEEEEEVEEEEEAEEVEKVEAAVEKSAPPKKVEPEPEEEEEVEEEEEYEEAEEPEDKPEPKPEQKPEPQTAPQKEVEEEEDESEYTEEEIESEKEEKPQKSDAPAPVTTEAPATTPAAVEPVTPKPESEKVEVKLEGKDEEIKEESSSQPVSEPADEPKPQPAPQPEIKVPLREPSIPLEKVEDVEIKPIGSVSETISKSHTEKTEIISGLPDKPSGAFSTQTEYNKIENIVTVNRTTKTLDHTYEQLTQQGVPTVRTYFAPGRERVSPTPQPARPYQPLYTPPQPQPQVERRHSLLLERLSTERQMPSDIYQKQTSLQQQYSNQNYEQQRQWSQEPQSEVVNDSNVKPSTITKNQQWYQQSKKENILYNNITPSTPAVPSQQWSQPPPQPQPQPQVQHQPQIQVQARPHYDYQQPYEIYTDNSLQDSSKFLSNTYQQNSYPSYTPAPNNWSNTNVGSTLPNVNTQSANQYSYLNKTSSENYQNTNQQYSSSYVPPPWEQDPNYVAPQLPTQSFYQPEPSSTNTFSPAAKPGWKPSPPAAKFSKPAPKSFIPPAPNQSFVKTAVPETTKRPGCKTYYSEYERRYITVPESTYIPADAKYQAQPDPSPQYYYDNNEPSEAVEHQWRKELREFTEKSQTTQTQQTNQTQQFSQQTSQHISEQKSVIPPWEEDPKYAKVPTVSYTPTPSWSQTIRPQSNRERSFESEYVQSNEWSKTNTLGRTRPLSTYQNSNIEISTPERPRGVSVDRYNPTKYQSPMTIPYDSEHGPVQAHTLDPTTAPHRGYHNPNVPAYHVNRASAEPREHQQTTGQARNWCVDSRATPVQSRSFKYLQWITGTED